MTDQDLRYILQNGVKPENFYVENAEDGTFSINLHIHTKYSDGNFLPEELLDHAVQYAEYRHSKGKTDPFVFAITDHDTLAGTQEAMEIISQNPKKYRNIRFVPGVEFNSFYLDEDNRKKQLEILAYCFDPFKLAPFMESIQKKNLDYFKQFVSEDVIKRSKYLKIAGSPAMMSEVIRAVKNPESLIEQHRKTYGSLSVNPGTPDVMTVVQAVKDSGSGLVGIAHPGRVIGKFNQGWFFEKMKSAGIEAAEVNYHYVPGDNVSDDLQSYIRQAVEKAGLLKTGGVDCHKKTLFEGRES